MKVLILAPNIDIVGGANVIVFKIARYLASKGDDVQIWSNFLYADKRFQESELIIRNIVKEFSDAIVLKRMLGIMSYLTLPKESNVFDLMFCHNFPSYFSALSPNFHGGPIVWQCNEPSVVLYPLPTEARQTTVFYSPFFMPPAYVLRKIDRLAVNRITRIAVLSQFAKNRVRLFYDRDSEIIRLGTDTNRFNPSLDGSAIRARHGISNRPCILTVGNVGKRVDLVLKAIASVKKVIPDVVYMIVGPSDAETKLRLVNLIRCLRLESNVILAGAISHSNELLPHYYASCDIFVSPQPYWAWSMVTIEAMATGKPVIVPNVGGVSEIISNGINGVKIPIENSELLAKTIITLLENETVRRKMGRLAREFVVEHLQENQFLAKTYDLLQRASNIGNTN